MCAAPAIGASADGVDVSSYAFLQEQPPSVERITIVPSVAKRLSGERGLTAYSLSLRPAGKRGAGTDVQLPCKLPHAAARAGSETTGSATRQRQSSPKQALAGARVQATMY
jgi:hypothetical protein